MKIRQFLAVSVSTALITQAAWASPQLKNHLEAYPSDTAALSVSKMDLMSWKKSIESLPDEGQDLMKEMQSELKKLKAEKGIDLFWDGLANLGEHFSLGYHQRANNWGELLFVIDIRSDQRAKRLLTQGLELLKEDAQEFSLSSSMFGGQKLHHLKVEGSDIPLFFTFAINDQQILGSFGHDDKGVKDMLYLRQVHDADSRFKLINHSGFNQTVKRLKASNSWLYADAKTLAKLIGDFVAEEAPTNEKEVFVDLVQGQWTQDMLNFYAALGFGAGFKNKQLLYHGHVTHKTENFSAYQKAYKQRLLELQKADIKAMTRHVPADSLLVLAGVMPEPAHWYDTASDAPLPQIIQELSKEFSPEAFAPKVQLAKAQKMFKEVTQLDAEQDLGRYWDGRYAMVMPKPAKLEQMGMVFSLGLKSAETDVAALWQKKLNLDLKALENTVMENITGGAMTRAQSSSVKANMHTLQTIVETYGVDWGGQYAPDLKSLKTEAQKTEGTSAYWYELTNPVAETSIAVMDYSEFSGEASQMGAVFYEPVKKGNASIIEYRIYGYAPDGNLYLLSNEDQSAMVIEKSKFGMGIVRNDLPQKESPQQAALTATAGEKVNGIQTFTVVLPEDIKNKIAKEFSAEARDIFEPSFAQRGDQLYLASNPQSLKQVLSAPGGNYQPFKKHAKLVDNPQGNSYFYLNFDSVKALAKPFTDEINEDPELKEILKALDVVHGFSASGQDQAKGSDFYLVADMDTADYPWLESLATPFAFVGLGAAVALPNFIGAQDRAKSSSVKANMHTMQTIVETYGVDWGGKYPSNVDVLYKEAHNTKYGNYWKDFNNPYTSKSGKGESYDDYSNFKAGENAIGRVYYQVGNHYGSPFTGYDIYGTDKQGELLQDKGQIFFLTNS